MSLRVLVLGGGGFIGTRIVRGLLARGFEPPRVACRHAQSLPPGSESWQLDAFDRVALDRALDGIDVVVNCVAVSPYAIRLQAQTLADAVRRRREQPRVVQLSSMAVYGDREGSVSEQDTAGHLSAYGAAKRDAEDILAGCAHPVMLRAGCVYGPDSAQWTRRIAALLRARRLGDLGAAGDGRCNLLHVDDLAAAVVQLLGCPPPGAVYNLAAPQPPTWNAYLIRFASLLSVTPISHIGAAQLAIEAYVGAPLLRMLAGFGFAGVPEAITPSLRALFRQAIALDSRAAERDLQLSWTPLDEGLAACAAALRAGGGPALAMQSE